MTGDLITRCQGLWQTILPRVGIPASSLTGNHCACPICGGKDRFRFDDRKPAGSGSWICNQCGSGYGIHLIQKVNRWSFREAADAIDALALGEPSHASPPSSEPAPTSLNKAVAEWDAGGPVDASSPVRAYLASRGLALAFSTEAIRAATRLVYMEDGLFLGRFPAMLAKVTGMSGELVGVHRTYLTLVGRKADVLSPRKMIGTLPPSAAVRLMEHGEVLGIAEGVENALSASALFAIPCWSAINSKGLAAWSPPAAVREVVVFGDNDTKFGGQAAAWSLAHRLTCTGLQVRVEVPNETGEDWNDVLMALPTS